MRPGVSRGLAAAAVAALTSTGLAVALPTGPAGAAGSNVVLLSLYNATNDTSVRTDDQVELTAMRLNPAATITFEYNANPDATDSTPGWTAIGGTATTVGDYVTLTSGIDPPLAGTTVAVRAVASVAGATART